MDMLVKLYDLANTARIGGELRGHDINVRRAMPYEKVNVLAWTKSIFGASAPGWASECDAAFCRVPVACYIAVHDRKIAGFACYDSTCKGFFGPIGVEEPWRRKGVGKALLLATLEAMRVEGYGYAIIGDAGVPQFFKHAVNAVEIPGSEPGIYADKLV